MISQVKTIDNVKQLLPIAGSAPSGNPVGTIISTYRKIQPRNYLYCDGSTFNAGTYPALYLYLGTNVLPDYRECALVGAEKNTTDVFDSTETNPSTGTAGTQNHDVYSEGEFKDDQIQNITGKINNTAQGTGDQFLTDTSFSSIVNEGALAVGDSKSRYSMSNTSSSVSSPSSITFDASRVARTGDVTHGKRKAVYYYIKAVDGVDISDEDTFLDTVKNYIDSKNSYSTSETLTGGKWIDGKPIYKRVFQKQCGSGNTDVYDFGSNTYIDTVVSSTVSIKQSNNAITLGSYYQGSSDLANIYINTSGKLVFRSGSNYAYGFVTIILEYTKTTDS